MSHQDAMREARVNRFKSEREFTNWTIAVYRINGWLVTHMIDSRRQHWATHKGIPDIIAVHSVHRRLHFIELKMKGNKPTLAQRVWIDALKRTARLVNTSSDIDLMQMYVYYPLDQEEIIMNAGGIAP
jgi:hypothetical protein